MKQNETCNESVKMARVCFVAWTVSSNCQYARNRRTNWLGLILFVSESTEHDRF